MAKGNGNRGLYKVGLGPGWNDAAQRRVAGRSHRKGPPPMTSPDTPLTDALSMQRTEALAERSFRANMEALSLQMPGAVAIELHKAAHKMLVDMMPGTRVAGVATISSVPFELMAVALAVANCNELASIIVKAEANSGAPTAQGEGWVKAIAADFEQRLRHCVNVHRGAAMKGSGEEALKEAIERHGANPGDRRH